MKKVQAKGLEVKKLINDPEILKKKIIELKNSPGDYRSKLFSLLKQEPLFVSLLGAPKNPWIEFENFVFETLKYEALWMGKLYAFAQQLSGIKKRNASSCSKRKEKLTGWASDNTAKEQVSAQLQNTVFKSTRRKK